jgi:hypothetical protein
MADFKDATPTGPGCARTTPQDSVRRGRSWSAEMPDTPGTPRDRAARPALDEVLALRADRMATVAAVIGGLTPESLAADTA